MVQFNLESSALVFPTKTLDSPQKTPFLHFYLNANTDALLLLQQSAEVLSIPRKEIVPIFFMPAWVTGVYNLRGEIVWVVDLAHLLGLSPCYEPQSTNFNFTILVLQCPQLHSPSTKGRNQLLGCIVNRLETIEYCNINDIYPHSTTDFCLLSVSQQYWAKSDSQQLAILDAAAIAQQISQAM